jgi:hypothetical protein
MKIKEYKYNIVAKGIAEEILPELEINNLLPSSAELCERYDTSEITVNKALKLLVERGFVKRVQSKGTVLVKKPGNLWEGQPVKDINLSILGIPAQSWNFMTAFENFIERFCEINPHVSYNITYCPVNEYSEHLENEKFDLILVNIWALRELMTRPEFDKRFLPLDKIPGLAYDEKAYFAEVIKWCSNQQGLACLPVTNSAVFQKVNLDYPGMGKYPIDKEITWDEFVAALREIKRQNSPDRPLFFLPQGVNYWPIFLKILGHPPFSDDGRKCMLDSPEIIEIIKMIYEFTNNERLFVNSISLGNSEEIRKMYDLFSAGTLAFTWSSAFMISKEYDFKCSYQSLPNQQFKTSHLLIEGIMVDRDTEYRDTVKDILNFIQTAGCQEFFIDCTGISSQKFLAQTYIDKLEKTHPGAQVVIDSLKYAEPVIKKPRAKVYTYVEQQLNMILLGILPLEETCRETAAEANRMLENENFID